MFFDFSLRHDISQGSVATHLRCVGIFSDDIIANFLLILTVKQIENWLIFGKVIRHTIMGYPVGYKPQSRQSTVPLKETVIARWPEVERKNRPNCGEITYMCMIYVCFLCCDVRSIFTFKKIFHWCLIWDFSLNPGSIRLFLLTILE